MNEQDLKRTLTAVHANKDMNEELIENCKEVANGANAPKKRGRMWSIPKGAVVAASLAVVLLTTTVYGDAIYKIIHQKIVLGDQTLYLVTQHNLDSGSASDITHIGAIAVTDESGEAENLFVSLTEYPTLEEAQEHLSFGLDISEFLLLSYNVDKIDVTDFGTIQSAGVYLSKDGKELYLHATPSNAIDGVTSSAGVTMTGDEDISDTDFEAFDDTSKHSLTFERGGVIYEVFPTSADSKDDLQAIVDAYN